jgi:major membrane immunogen (membrane-anchored lipoprotein)
MKNKKMYIIFCALITAVVLPGCAQVDSYLENKVDIKVKDSIENLDEFKEYQQYKESGLLDENGSYRLDIPNSDEVDTTDLIPITFANNQFISCNYYRNDEYTPISGDVCYLKLGDSLLVSNVTTDNPNSNLYEFSEFRIWSYDSEGEKGVQPYAVITNDSGLLLTIPEDYSGTGFSVEPIGKYRNREIKVGAYCIDGDGQQQKRAIGTWTVNGNEFSNATSISPVESYTLVFDYSKYKDDFYLVSSEPQYWYSKESNQTVIFKEASANEEKTEFSVIMHSFVTIDVINDNLSVADYMPLKGNAEKGIITSIRINNKEWDSENENKSFAITKLKVDDVVTIRVAKDYKLTGTNVNVGTALALGSNAENGYEYTIIVPDTNKQVKINVTKRNSDADGKYAGYNLVNAELTLERADGSTIQIGDELPGDNEKINIKIEPHSGYYLTGKNINDDGTYTCKMKYADFEKNAVNIFNKHEAEKYISITLDYIDSCGTCTYKVDGKDVSDKTISVKSGQTITLKYTANSDYTIVRDGWVSEHLNSLIGKNTVSAKIEVTDSMDGTTFNRDSFNIKLEKVG